MISGVQSNGNGSIIVSASTTLMRANGNSDLSFVLIASSLGSACVAATGVTTISKALKVKIDGTTYYIPLCTGTT